MSRPSNHTPTHYWCDFCSKFIKNTSIDRKNHELGSLHQTNKAKKIDDLRAGGAKAKLDEEIAALEKAAEAATAHQTTSSYHSSYSTYTPVDLNKADNIPKSKPAIAAQKVHSAQQSSNPSTTAHHDQIPSNLEQKDEPLKTEASMPGQWEVVEEETSYNEFYRPVNSDDENDADPSEQSKSNAKKRSRYAEEEDPTFLALEDAQHKSKAKNAERVPQQYKHSEALIDDEETASEPVFKKKQMKGGNVRKRVKQL